MRRWLKQASWSISLFNANRFRVAVLFAVIISLLPDVTFGQAISSNVVASLGVEADFIIGPQAAISSSWFDSTEVEKARVHGEACPTTPPTDPTALNSFVLLNYYDLPLTEYVVYTRTGDPTFLTYARKCADAWWKHPDWIREGAQRDFDNGGGPPPRHAGIAGLMLRALDGRPEMWDWIVAYTQHQFNVWLKMRINNSSLYYGVREGAFMLHYATWLAKALPDSYPLQAGGIATNGAQTRAQLLADVESVSVQYFGRLQQPDGSWRWNTSPDEFVDTDGGTLVGIMQPFMIGLLLNALIDVHRLSTDSTVKMNIQNQITKACHHLYEGGAYRKDEPVPVDPSKRWRSFWYFYHGGTTVNPTKYENGGGSEDGTVLWHVSSERQSISTIFSAYGYAYLITGDPSYKTMGDELFDSAFVGSDGIRGLADGTAKNYNQTYRMGGRYLVWRQGSDSFPSPSATPTPNPTPTPTPTPNPTPTPTPTPSPTPTATGPVVKKAKKHGQSLSNELAASTSSPDVSGPVQMDTSEQDALALFTNEILEAQTNFNAERQIFPAANRIELELNYALDCALQAETSSGLGDVNGVMTHLRDALNHLELSDVLITNGNISNPIDVASYMVRQHYIDFLDREPDEAGNDFWVNQILSCGTDTVCTEVRRIHVSAAFFLSIEFRQTGYFVYRLYKASYGRMPLRVEFMPDTRAVARGVIVGALNWEQDLAANKQAFLDEWVQRGTFITRYSRLNNRQYVDALIANLGVTISSSDRNSLIFALANGASRATILGRLVENDAFQTAQINSAFVLMEYFGYLGRDPDAGGFNFWLDKLNQFNGDYGRAEMVRAFLSSIEYRDRFRLQ